MARHPIKIMYIARSDGKKAVKHSKSKLKEENQPTKSQLEKSVDKEGIESYYQAVPIGHAKSMEWRKKLGGMLMKELGKPYDESYEYCIADFPENYRLFEHCRVSPKSLRPGNATSKYSNERRDYYLYGHPGGRKKRYRSPADFLPHLLWLATDPDEIPNHDRCDCKWAQQEGRSPADLSDTIIVKQPKSEGMAAKGFSVQIPVSNIRKTSISATQEKQQTPISKTTPAVVKVPVAPIAPTAPVAPVVIPQPTKLSSARNAEQEMDFQCDKYLYRPGEIVWFNRGSSWGLSVIVARGFFKDQNGQDRPEYNVQPLSHPYDHPQIMTINQEDRLRPWLAWSAPAATHQALNSEGFTYDTINWGAVVQRMYGPGDAEVDGSIFAAKAVDSSYTPFEPLKPSRPNAMEKYYNGVFVGGEKIWVGEAIRLRIEKDIMILHHIVEIPEQNDLLIIGDIYTFETLPYETSRPIPQNSYLPIRVREDLNYRNRATVIHKKQISFWKLTHPSARLSLSEVKGRWYESRVLLPIIQGQAAFTQLYSRGEIGDVGDKLNGRGDATNTARKLGTKRADRLEALGGAVPPGTIIEGMVPRAQPMQNVAAAAFAMDPALTNAQDGGGAMEVDGVEGQVEVNDSVMSEFMDVGQMEEGDYGQVYLENLAGGNNFG